MRYAWVLLLASASLPACIFSPNSLPDLEQRADLIVVGSASGVYRTGTPSVFSVEIARVVKGDSALAGQGISVSWTPVQCGFTGSQEFTVRGTGIWFLGRSNSGWTLIPIFAGAEAGFFSAPPGPILPAYSYAPDASLDDKLAAETASAIESATREEMFLGQPYLLESLDELKSPMVPLLYRHMSGSTLPRQRILGLAGFIRSGSTAALTSAIQSEPDFARYNNENGILRGSISARFRAADPDSIRILGEASSDTANLNPEFREAVAHALASIHTKNTLPYLAALLDDPLLKLRLQGVAGLASFANNLPIPADPSAALSSRFRDQPGPYKNEDTLEHFPNREKGLEPDEAMYLAFWKNWWSRNRASLGY